MDTAAKILVAILLALLVYLFYTSFVAPYFITSSQEALMTAKQNLAKDLTGTCKEWTDNLALASQFPSDLEAKATAADVGWDYCADFKSNTPDNQQRCRASCVKLLRFDDRCSADPAAFGGLTYDYRNRLMTAGGVTAAATKEGASQYCLYLMMPTIKSEVAAEFP